MQEKLKAVSPAIGFKIETNRSETVTIHMRKSGQPL